MILSFAFRFPLTAFRVVKAPLHAVIYATSPCEPWPQRTRSTFPSPSRFTLGIILSFPLLLYFLAGFHPAGAQRAGEIAGPARHRSQLRACSWAGWCFCFNLHPADDPALSPQRRERNMGFRAEQWTVGQYFLLCLAVRVDLRPVVRVTGGRHRAGETSACSRPSTLRKTRAYAFVIILVLAAAFVAPSPDPLTLGHRRWADAAALRGSASGLPGGPGTPRPPFHHAPDAGGVG